MNLLLDTHAFLWAIGGDPRLGDRAGLAFLDAQNTLYFSIVSYWEICIKHALGKLDLASNWQRAFDNEMATNGIRWLALEKEHCPGIIDLPQIHGDPFDRLLVSQAMHEDFTLVTRDANFSRYQIDTLW
jgi:PIN domain nuclease of toxin-antitoxin system